MFNQNAIRIQAYHGLSFVASDCFKYPKPNVWKHIEYYLLRNTVSLTDSVDSAKKSEEIGVKCHFLEDHVLTLWKTEK